MQERIADLESQLGNETDSFLPAQEEAGSFISAMLEETEIGGFVAASYNYNFENFSNDDLSDVAGDGNKDREPANFNPSHASSNAFQIDQAWISIHNEATEDSRAGVHLDYEWGNVNGAGGGGALYSASISYLAPIGDGIMLDGGLMPTLIGAEVNQTNANLNVTRGQVWELQPVTNVGLVAGMQLTDDISVSLGVLNDQNSAPVVDDNNEKAITGQLGWSSEDTTASFQFVWGQEGMDVDTGIWDFLLTHSGIEDVQLWVNYTLVTFDPDGGSSGETHGIAAAARMAMSEKCGIAIRGEAVIVDTGTETETYSATVTTDYALTSHLTAKGEVRFDIAPDDILPGGEDFAALVLAQLVYEF